MWVIRKGIEQRERLAIDASERRAAKKWKQKFYDNYRVYYVGYYDEDREWVNFGKCGQKHAAAMAVNFLNGGNVDKNSILSDPEAFWKLFS
jgi:hypothetical protein